jgi:hypothetical protein
MTTYSPKAQLSVLFHGNSNMVKAMDLIIYPLMIRAGKRRRARTVLDKQGKERSFYR